MAFYMYKTFEESAIFIGLILLAIERDSHRPPQCKSAIKNEGHPTKQASTGG
jgi:hypothetical protein